MSSSSNISISNTMLQILMQNSMLAEFKNTLISLKSNNEKVSFILKSMDDFGISLPHVDGSKSKEIASKSRRAGNLAVVHGKFSSALRCYTDSIANAPSNSEELGMAFANRSFILFEMGLPKEAIGDIQRAIVNQYPLHLKYKVLKRQGECLKQLGKPAQAFLSFKNAKLKINESHNMLPGMKEKLIAEIDEEINTLEVLENEEPLNFWNISKHQVACEHPELVFGANIELPYASQALQLCYNKKRGRHLVATRSLQPGDIVMVERPFISRVQPKDRRTHHCLHCWHRSPALLPCQNCTWAMFCSEDCIQAASFIHTKECAIIPSLFAMQLHPVGHQALRLFMRMGTAELSRFIDEHSAEVVQDKRTVGFTNGRLEPDSLLSAYHCYQNTENRSFIQQFYFAVASAVLIKLLPDLPHPIKFGGFFYHVQLGFFMNSTYITELSKLKNIPGQTIHKKGIGIFPTYSLLNHSCDPNLTINFYGNTLVARVNQPIKKGTEVVTSYHDISFRTLPLMERQTRLLAKCGFKCTCAACKGNWPLAHNQPVFPIRLGNGLDNIFTRALLREELNDLLDKVKRQEMRMSPSLAFRLTKQLMILSGIPGGRLCHSFALCQQLLKLLWAYQANFYEERFT